MADVGEFLVMRRPKRSTAGNRMEAALAEFRAEDIGVDLEEDNDFVVEKDEEDAFESDFESTDDEAAQEDVDAAEEKRAKDEDRMVHKESRSKLDRITAAAHARHKATFHPELESEQTRGPSNVKRRASLGAAVHPETGEIVEGTKRQSRRTHTMQNTSATVSRMKDAKEKKSSLPKKAKISIRAPTQDELIARALDMEEGNVVEHRNYLASEEEKRKKARLVRTTIQGPLLRWVSKVEEVKVPVEPSLPQPAEPSYTYPYPYTYVSPTPHYASAPAITPGPSTTALHPSGSTTYQPAPQSQSSALADTSAQHTPSAAYSYPQYAPPNVYPHPQYLPPTHYAYPYAYPLHDTRVQVAPAPPTAIERTEKHTRSYVVHEVSQMEKQRPLWQSTMSAMFGDHVNWEELRVYTSKGRPLTRPTQICPITGKVARYRDPRTNVPFADLEGFETLTELLAHEYVWSDSLGCYVG